MIYALWHTVGRNIIGTYDTEAEALLILREAAERYGQDYLEPIALVQEDERGESTTLAMGSAALTQRMHDHAAVPSQVAPKRR